MESHQGTPRDPPGLRPILMTGWSVHHTVSMETLACMLLGGRKIQDYGAQLWSPWRSEGGRPKEKDKEMMGKDVSAGFSREKSRPFPCAQLGALGVPRSGGLRPDLRLTNTSASLWKTLVQPWANGRLRPCHVCQQPAGGGFSRDISQPRDDTS